MATQCTSNAFPLAGLGRRQVVAKFDGGRLSSDGGAVLLRAANQAFQVTGRLAACFIDHRNPARVEHSLESLLGQRVFALALGYEDINDHDRLRDDSLLALALDGPDLTGQSRRRERDRGHALAGSSTLNRLELGTLLEADEDRYKKVVASTEQIDDLLVDLFLDMHETLPERIVLDVDATDDQLHGQQEGRFYHGYYRHYCYLPLYITCGEHVLCARLRTAQAEAAEGTVAELERIVRRIRQRWPQAAIVVRGDAGFCRDTLMSWCEQRGVDYVLGLARNSRLLGQIRRQLQQAGKACARSVTTGPTRALRPALLMASDTGQPGATHQQRANESLDAQGTLRGIGCGGFPDAFSAGRLFVRRIRNPAPAPYRWSPESEYRGRDETGSGKDQGYTRGTCPSDRPAGHRVAWRLGYSS